MKNNILLFGLGLFLLALVTCKDDPQVEPDDNQSVNNPPTNVMITSTSVLENESSGTLVGVLSTTDSDDSDTHTYSLVSGAGSTDNSSFNIDGTSLRSSAIFDFETKSSYSIRIRSTDSEGLTFDKVFTIGIVNVDENQAPTNITLSSNTIPEKFCSKYGAWQFDHQRP